jgi:starch-binding outer membrane protein, SusD/RagB family
MKKNIVLALLFSGLLTLTQCKDYFEKDTNDVLASKNYMGNVEELYAGFRGIASAVQNVADHAIFLTELRGDLLEPTANAPQELWDIYNYSNAENSFNDPKGYYNVIINANDFIGKSTEYYSKNPNAIDSTNYKELVSGAIRFKCWAYLMLAKIYGEAVYFDDPLAEYSDISKYPLLKLPEVIQKCLTLMNVGVNGINGKRVLPYSNILSQGVTSSNQLKWDMICPAQELLMIELNLWAGNFSDVVNLAVPLIYDAGSKRYKLSNEDWNAEWSQFFYADFTTKTKELMTVVPFAYKYNQTNRIVTYFSNMSPNKYYLRPTQVARDRYNAQRQSDGFNTSDKYRGDGYTFDEMNGDWILRKSLKSHETSDKVYQSDIHIILYRAADIHLFLAEALNQLELIPEAEAVLNDGIANYVNTYTTNARYPFNNSVYNAVLIQNLGIRGRVSLAPAIQMKSIGMQKYFVYGKDTTRSQADYSDSLAFKAAYKKAFDIALVEETCMESAGEARSLFAMERIAQRYNDPNIIADRVSAKYSASQKQRIHDLLLNQQDWYVHFNLKK